MKATVFLEPGKMAIKEMPKPELNRENEAIIRVVRASVCGSDLWWYRGISKKKQDLLRDMKRLVS